MAVIGDSLARVGGGVVKVNRAAAGPVVPRQLFGHKVVE
jgi:hypothetical protein